MPIPNPKSGETQDEFISRCISEIYDEYGDSQSAAICYSKFRENMSTENKINSKLSQARKYEGLILKSVYAEGLEDACWEGYEAIGTKILDGREVPNCVPVE